MKTTKYSLLSSSLLGRPLENTPYQILGAGISGLLMGYHLKKQGIPFKIYEQSDKAGGILGSEVCEFGIAEKSANGFLWCEALENLSNDLGIPLQLPGEAHKARYLVRDGRLQKFPLGWGEAIGTFLRVLLPHKQNFRTVEEFGIRHFGESFTQYLLEPGLLGIYSGQVSELSFPGVLTPIAKMLNENNSLVYAGLKNRLSSKKNTKKIGGTISYSNGMQTLIDALVDYLKEDIQYNILLDKEQVERHQSILCIPAYAAASYLNPPLSNILRSVKYNSIISVTTFVERKQLEKFKPGFGCLINRKENYNILGVLFNSCIFPSRVHSDQHLSLTCILRDFDGKLSRLSDIDLKELVKEELGTLLGMEGPVLEQKVYRWPKGIPLYSPDLYENWFKLQEGLQDSNIRLFGNYTGEISIRAMATQADLNTRDLR